VKSGYRQYGTGTTPYICEEKFVKCNENNRKESRKEAAR